MKNDAEHLVSIVNNNRVYDGRILKPAEMLWKCTTPNCVAAPKVQRRKQYENRAFCNACANRVKSKSPEFLAKRGAAISRAIKEAGSKWSEVAKKNMSSLETRQKISHSVTQSIKNSPDALEIRRKTALKNNKVTKFGTSEFAKRTWSECSTQQRKERIIKAFTKLKPALEKVHIDLMKERHPKFELIEFGKIDNTYKCPVGHLFFMRGNNFLKRANCPECVPKSVMQNSFYEWFKQYFPETKANKRVLYLDENCNGNNALEIDIYNEDLRFGIETHGLFYHKESSDKYGVDKGFHKKKYDLAKKHNIKLLQFFEDELEFNLDIVKSMVLSKCGIYQNMFYARKCEVKPVNLSDSNEFLNKNHIQGQCKSFLRLGLYYDNQLVALITFRKNKENVEIARFCCLLNTSTVGGFSRLLSYGVRILKEKKFQVLLTYSDNRYSDGDVYKNNGFIFSHETEPDMFWTKKNMRYPRQISWGVSDSDMYQQKYYKIYGAGHKLWKKNL